jgi:hypothetical protein
MSSESFWQLIERARAGVADPADDRAVAAAATKALAEQEREVILATQQAFWDLMADSYRSPLWAAAYLINGGCSDDMFDYFRGWLVLQGKDTFERAVADPDTLADLPAIRSAAADGEDVECESALAIAYRAYLQATGEEIPPRSFTIRYPALDPDWGFDLDDQAEMSRRLPRLAALYRL